MEHTAAPDSPVEDEDSDRFASTPEPRLTSNKSKVQVSCPGGAHIANWCMHAGLIRFAGVRKMTVMLAFDMLLMQYRLISVPQTQQTKRRSHTTMHSVACTTRQAHSSEAWLPLGESQLLPDRDIRKALEPVRYEICNSWVKSLQTQAASPLLVFLPGLLTWPTTMCHSLPHQLQNFAAMHIC